MGRARCLGKFHALIQDRQSRQVVRRSENKQIENLSQKCPLFEKSTRKMENETNFIYPRNTVTVMIENFYKPDGRNNVKYPDFRNKHQGKFP
ncbi:hypothetical protein JTE90_026066 [Oedothorax gibbosus]|uniref:Uncharacterized protein n=1 Tax=Oedothorax gibbosus TaxID=931172 RepID=A0AAV6TK77_9ARAC|nr:hypothetical protein JTE90_026066 [Oedothorax gibbosus]